MKRGREKTLLRYLLKHCARVDESIARCNDYSEFMQNVDIQDVVILHLLHIGELSGKLSTDIKERYPNISWSVMRTIRNVAAHDYYSVSLSDIWRIAVEEIPLVQEICADELTRLSQNTEQ